jgi:uncharacterized protein (DUF2164 family)
VGPQKARMPFVLVVSGPDSDYSQFVSIELNPEQKKRAIASIKTFAAHELDQDLGDLEAGLVLDFILEEIAPCVYNRAIADAQTFLRDRVADLEGVCYHAEFAYWQEPRG